MKNFKLKTAITFTLICTLFSQLANANDNSDNLKSTEKVKKNNLYNYNDTLNYKCSLNLYQKPLYVGKDKENLEQRSKFLCYENYVIFYDPMTKTPLWVSEKIDYDIDVTNVKNLLPDPNIDEMMQASLDDYKDKGFSIGAMAASYNMRSKKAIAESFYMTNMVPQVGPNMKDSIWTNIERTIRSIANEEGPLYVITGPAFISKGKPITTIGENKVWVPTHLYKIVYSIRDEKVIMSYMIPNRQIRGIRTKSLDAGNVDYPQTTSKQAVSCNNTVCSVYEFGEHYKDIEKAVGWKFF